jgi:dermatan/chondrotin sulfate uronyl 2-O-sulfotransferase UST
VVGILEELNATLAVLENRLPYFFRGLQKIYFQDLMGMESQVSDSNWKFV